MSLTGARYLLYKEAQCRPQEAFPLAGQGDDDAARAVGSPTFRRGSRRTGRVVASLALDHDVLYPTGFASGHWELQNLYRGDSINVILSEDMGYH